MTTSADPRSGSNSTENRQSTVTTPSSEPVLTTSSNTSTSNSEANTSTTNTSSTTTTSSSNNSSSSSANPRAGRAHMLNLGGHPLQAIPMDGDGVVFMHVGPNGITIDSMSAQMEGEAGECKFLQFYS